MGFPHFYRLNRDRKNKMLIMRIRMHDAKELLSIRGGFIQISK